jgi:glucosamine--fructose-6-phosphate aminotransferase (isomerizing)
VCSIIAYASCNCNDVSSILLDSLSLLEYRGYDSVGIAVLNGSSISVRKGVGNVKDVNRKHRLEELVGSIGIGHTRWATHGSISDLNAHPHTSCDGRIAIVHNGIIDNYLELREGILKDHSFKSETDSEVIAHMLEHLLSRHKDIKDVMVALLRLLHGSYAFVALLNDGTLVGSRHNEPLIVGVVPSANSILYHYANRKKYNDVFCSSCFISSDVLAFIKYTDKAIFLSNDEFFILRPIKHGYRLSIYDAEGNKIGKQITQVAWELSSYVIDKGKYAHYTLKEIHEQEYTIARALCSKINHEFITRLIDARRVIVTGSGSSYNASLYAKHLLARVGVNIDACIASEVRYSSISIDSNDVLLAISQSGETADLLDAVRYAKSKGCKILSIVNVNTSSLVRESDYFTSINAGPEIGVAATKSFTAQLAVIYKVASLIAHENNSNYDYSIYYYDSLSSAISKGVRDIIAREHLLSSIADTIKGVNDIYVIGKGVNHIIALEGALKLKELAYIHAEAINAGELKHGPLALIDNSRSSVVIALNVKDNTYKDVINNVKEVKARGGYVIGISDCYEYKECYDVMLDLPSIYDTNERDCGFVNAISYESLAYPVYQCIPLQLLAYNIAVKKNYNPDYPRNIAKSVTVT